MKLRELFEAKKLSDAPDILQDIKKKCGEALKLYQEKGFCLYRGLTTEVYPAEITPKQRASKISQHFTPFLFVTRDPSWSKFPRRDHSIMCTTNLEYANEWESFTAAVFPYDNTVFGITEGEDFNLDSFPHVENALRTRRKFHDTMESVDRMFSRLTRYDADAKSSLGEISDYFKNAKSSDGVQYDAVKDYIEKTKSMYSKELDAFFKELLKHDGNIVSLYRELFDPKKNGFQIAKGMDELYSKVRKETREVWFDNKCIYVPVEWLTMHKNTMAKL